MRKAFFIIAVFSVLVLASSYAHGGWIALIDAALAMAIVAIIGVVLWFLYRAIG